jgi:hypothetical protein
MSKTFYRNFNKLQIATSIIATGTEEHPVSNELLANHLFVNKRTARSIVSDMRRMGIPVLNSWHSDHGGYWISTSQEEIDRWKQAQINRLRRSRWTVTVATTYQPPIPGLLGGE